MLYIQVLLHREGPSHRDGFTQRDDFITGCFYLQIFLRGDAFNTGIRAHTGAWRYKYLRAETNLLRETFTPRRVYTQVPPYRDAFTQVFLHANTSTQRFYARLLLHRDSVTRKHMYTETLWHTVADAFTCKYFDTAKLILRTFSLYIEACSVTTWTLLITHAFTQRYFDIKTALHRHAFPWGCFHTQKCIFTHKYFYRGDAFTLKYTDLNFHVWGLELRKAQKWCCKKRRAAA